MAKYAEAIDGVRAMQQEPGAARCIPGSFDELCVRYFRSADFGRLKPSTQQNRRNIIEALRQNAGHCRMRDLTRAHLKSLIDCRAMKRGPESVTN